MAEKWRCPRCGHEIVVSPEAARRATSTPRCHECATFEVVVPGERRMLCPLLMVKVC